MRINFGAVLESGKHGTCETDIKRCLKLDPYYGSFTKEANHGEQSEGVFHT